MIWEGVKRAELGVALDLCATPTGKSDEGGRASYRVLCMCATASCRGCASNLLDSRREKCHQNLIDNRLESALSKLGKVP